LGVSRLSARPPLLSLIVRPQKSGVGSWQNRLQLTRLLYPPSHPESSGFSWAAWPGQWPVGSELVTWDSPPSWSAYLVTCAWRPAIRPCAGSATRADARTAASTSALWLWLWYPPACSAARSLGWGVGRSESCSTARSPTCRGVGPGSGPALLWAVW